MPVTIQDLENQRARVRESTTQAAASAGFGEEFYSRVQEELKNRSATRGVDQLTSQMGAASERFVRAPSEVREGEGVMTIDPIKRMGLEAERRGGALNEMTRIAGLQQRRQGTVEEIIQGLADVVRAQAMREAAAAEAEQMDFGNLSSIFSDQQRAEEAAFNRMMAQEQLNLQRASLAASNARANQPSAAQQEKARFQQALITDANRGVSPEDLVYKYGRIFDLSEIMNVYPASFSSSVYENLSRIYDTVNRGFPNASSNSSIDVLRQSLGL